MKILVFARGIPSIHDPQEGCFELDQALALKERGHEVVIMSIDARLRRYRHQWGVTKGNLYGMETYKIYFGTFTAIEHFVSFKLAQKIYRRLALTLYKTVSQDHPDIDLIHAHFLNTISWAVPIKEKFGVPLVGTEHWSVMVKDNLPENVMNLASATYPKVDCVVSVSNFLKEKLRDRFGIESTVCPNVLSKEFADTRLVKGTPSCHKYAFVSCGSLLHRKGYDLIIRAASALDIPRDQWQIKIIGEGPLRKSLEKQVEDCGLTDNVIFLGRMQKREIASTLMASDCFILASRSETFGVVVIEANAMGLPVIATDCGGTKGLVDDNNGIMIPCDDVDRLASAMETMYHDSKKMDPGSIRRDCLMKYSPDAVGRQLEEIYSKTLKERGK